MPFTHHPTLTPDLPPTPVPTQIAESLPTSWQTQTASWDIWQTILEGCLAAIVGVIIATLTVWLTQRSQRRQKLEEESRAAARDVGSMFEEMWKEIDPSLEYIDAPRESYFALDRALKNRKLRITWNSVPITNEYVHLRIEGFLYTLEAIRVETFRFTNSDPRPTKPAIELAFAKARDAILEMRSYSPTLLTTLGKYVRSEEIPLKSHSERDQLEEQLVTAEKQKQQVQTVERASQSESEIRQAQKEICEFVLGAANSETHDSVETKTVGSSD